MSPVHPESAFGDAIVASLLANGWQLGHDDDYRADLGLDTAQLFTFLGATQADEWEELVSFYGGDRDAAQRGFAKRLDQAITNDGLLDVLRRGVKDHGVRIRNGIPVATAELKNPLTGQGVEHAKEQYRTDRDPTELIFSHRVVASFAVDPDLVFVTTQVRGKQTRFLPFNTGSDGPGRPGGKGNPSATVRGAYPTSYLGERIWPRDTWLELLERFVHLHKEKGTDGRARKALIFPRYHQWDVVTKLTDHVARPGAGHNYLVMASAGSGKSNTIAWLAHRLSSLHTLTDPAGLAPEAVEAGLTPGAPVFDKVVVITDRRNLDAQLRETVGSFERTAGLVVKIDERHGAKSEQLARALSRSTGKIVTVTLHTFPALVEYLKRTPTAIQGSGFAIVLDEAHSSQSGDAAASVRTVLRDLGLDADSDDEGATSAPAPRDTEAKLTARAGARQHSPNLSYFAFTATPKAKTLQQFGTLDEAGTYRPFHTYSMRQAIEEGFILDPLRNYVTYNTYWRLVDENPDEREVDPAKANPLLARYALTHDSTAQGRVMAPPLLVEDEMQAFAEAYLAADEQAAGTPAGPTPAPVTAQGRHAPSRLPSAKDPDPPPEAPAGPALGNSGERASGHHAMC